jgi:hypothetical protein
VVVHGIVIPFDIRSFWFTGGNFFLQPVENHETFLRMQDAYFATEPVK